MLLKIIQQGVVVTIIEVASVTFSKEKNEVMLQCDDGEQISFEALDGAPRIEFEVYTYDGVLMADFTLEARKH